MPALALPVLLVRAADVRRALILAAAVAVAAPAAAQLPADVSMGFTFGTATPAVVGEVTEHLNDRLAVVGGAYWGAGRPVAVGFHVGPRLYTESAGRLRPFGELAAGFSSTPDVHGFIFTPALGVEVGIGRRSRFRTSAGVGLGLGGRGGGTGFNVTTALVLLPARER